LCLGRGHCFGLEFDLWQLAVLLFRDGWRRRVVRRRFESEGRHRQGGKSGGYELK
jgi:hypothetical protein